MLDKVEKSLSGGVQFSYIQSVKSIEKAPIFSLSVLLLLMGGDENNGAVLKFWRRGMIGGDPLLEKIGSGLVRCDWGKWYAENHT